MQKALSQLLAFMASTKPDILCIQEMHAVNAQALAQWQQKHSMICLQNFKPKNNTKGQYAGTAILLLKPTHINSTPCQYPSPKLNSKHPIYTQP